LTQIGRSKRGAGDIERPTPGQPCPDELVGRTSASALGRALVPTNASPRSAPAGTRSSGTFLAQLIATALKAPQTRARRRAEPADASAAYDASAAATAAVAGSVVYRSL
jgi:hypothetical protein